MREGWRLQKNKLTEHLLQHNKKLSVFILYVGKDLPEYDMVFQKTGIIIDRLIKLSNETT